MEIFAGSFIVENLFSFPGFGREYWLAILALDYGASIFSWMLRAWVERYPISKFMALFIPLEIILSGYGRNEADEREKEKLTGYEKIRKIISGSGEEDSQSLINLFDNLAKPQRPSLNSRFEQLAKEANLSGYPKHIAAFKRFNAIRNELLHQGNPEISLEVSVNLENIEQENQQLEDLVERYVSWMLFRDQMIYPSSWRK